MKKALFFIVSVLLLSETNSFSQKKETSRKDSLESVVLQEVQITSTRAGDRTPVAFTTTSKNDIEKVNTGVDIPYLLQSTPSLITTSDAGAGIGYTTLRIRGTDASRINVTANGVPMNDAESQALYWVDMGDFSSSLQDIQIQRGAGTSTNGAGAFGGSVNMQTEIIPFKAFTELDASYGSFNTHKETLKFGSGLLNNHFALEGRLSDIGTDGYINRAFVHLNSYFLQGGYYNKNTVVRFITFNGIEHTYHAWNYASKDEMAQYGRRYNSCGEYTDDQGRTEYYKNQTDNYQQATYQLLLTQKINDRWNLNAVLHYTNGAGYYEEYKPGSALNEYGLSPFMIVNPITKLDSTVTTSDLVRQKKMANDFYGGVFSANYNSDKLSATIGGALNQYIGRNFGQVIWIKNYIGSLDPLQEYYRNKSDKIDGNIYMKANYNLWKGLNVYGDLQLRHISYKINGVNDKWDYINNKMQGINVNDNFNFFNPKGGLFWKINNRHMVYASFAIAQREPTRDDYTNNDVKPKSEKMYDYELGYDFSSKIFTAGINLYYMYYKNQLVLTGQLSKIGDPIDVNVPQSYRSGIEITAGLHPFKYFSWNANATLSKNRIKNFIETLYENEDPSTTPWIIYHGNTPISFSPDLICNNIFDFNIKGFDANLQSQYVSKQYLSNAKQEDCRIDPYFVSNLRLSYTFRIPHIQEITAGFTVYNLFNEQYENNGYAGSGYTISNGQKVRYNYSGYSAQAGTNVIGNIILKF